MKAVLPVAGNGTRMAPIGVTTPKALIPVLNKPLIEWTLEALAENGIDEVIVITSAGKFGSMIRDHVEKLQDGRYPFKISIVVQEQQLGTAHVIQMAKDFFAEDEEFIHLYGDDLYGAGNIAEVKNADGLAVVGKEVTDPEKWGIFATNEDNNLVSVVEKPSEYVGNLANIGCMKLSGKVFEIYNSLQISVRGEYEITDSLQLLAEQQPVKVIPASDYWIPIGYPWHILEAADQLLPLREAKVEGDVAETAVLNGNITVPKSSKILPGCYLEGNILVGENVTIGPNARVRGNTVLGDDVLIGFGVDVARSMIGARSHVAHLAYIGDSILGEDCNVSGGCVVANFRHDAQIIHTPVKGVMTSTGRSKFGTVLGNGVKLGVNTSIYPGRKIWPGLTTKPGQVVDRDLSDITTNS